MSGKYGAGKTLLYSFIIITVFFLLLEAGLRLYVAVKAEAEHGRSLPVPAQRNIYQREDAVLGYSLTPGYDTEELHINALGFRGPSITLDKPPGVTRVLAIGDSTTFGLYGKECPYPAQLQILFDRKSNNKHQIINGGVEGYNTHHALRLLEERATDLDLDTVLVYIGWNDLYGTNPFLPQAKPLASEISETQSNRHPKTTLASVSEVLSQIYIAQAIRRIIYITIPRIIAKSRQSESRKNKAFHADFTTRYKDQLSRIIEQVRRISAEPVLMTLPSILSRDTSSTALSLVHYPGWAASDAGLFYEAVGQFNNAIRQVAEEQGVRLIDNAEFFDGMQGGKEQYFFDSLHMYCNGYALMAENIFVELNRTGALPGAKQ